jgi:hypothetical protein
MSINRHHVDMPHDSKDEAWLRKQDQHRSIGFQDRVREGAVASTGMALTAGVLGYGFYKMVKTPLSNRKAAASSMGLRVVAQGLTVAALVGYGWYQHANKSPDPKSN